MTLAPAYTTFEKLPVSRPVDRAGYFVEQCRGKAVLDLGCYDETALSKQGTLYWLHAQISQVAGATIGLDSSSSIPSGGIKTGPKSHIIRGNVDNEEDMLQFSSSHIDTIVAGELIEHLQDTLSFLKMIKRGFSGRTLIASTPNASSITSAVLGLFYREPCHPDHLQIYSYKTLNSLCLRANFLRWEILPYYVRYSEMLLRSSPTQRGFVKAAERLVNATEWLFPLRAGGLILHVKEI